MRKTKFIVMLIAVCLISLITTYSSAITFTAENKEVKPGEEFTIELKVDEPTFLANSHISFDSNIFEFKGSTQNNLSANELEPGEVAWMYTDMNQNSTGTQSFEFKFKVKDDATKKQDSKFTISDLILVTNSNEYEGNQISGNKEFNVTIQGKSSVNIIIIIIVIVVFVCAAFTIMKRKSKPKKH